MCDRINSLSKLFTATILAFTLSACAGGETDDTSPGEDGPAAGVVSPDSLTITEVGFATPESVLHDEVADVYLVSNVNGNPLDRDENGFISRLSPEGEVLELKWIDGEAEGVDLSAPKGMAIVDDVLYVTDIDCIRIFDRVTGAPERDVCVDGASFLNDLAPHADGGVVFTDTGRNAAFEPTGTDAVYHLSGGEYETLVADSSLGGPNGVTMRGDEILMVSFFGGEIFEVGEGEAEPLFPAFEGAQLDGIEILGNGRLLVSDWGSSCVLFVDADGNSTCIVENVQSPADIGIDRGRNRVLIPTFSANEVWVRPIG